MNAVKFIFSSKLTHCLSSKARKSQSSYDGYRAPWEGSCSLFHVLLEPLPLCAPSSLTTLPPLAPHATNTVVSSVYPERYQARFHLRIPHWSFSSPSVLFPHPTFWGRPSLISLKETAGPTVVSQSLHLALLFSKTFSHCCIFTYWSIYYLSPWMSRGFVLFIDVFPQSRVESGIKGISINTVESSG